MFSKLSLFISIMMRLHTAAEQADPKGNFEGQPQQTAKCLETFHVQAVSSAGDGGHVSIRLELLLEPEIL